MKEERRKQIEQEAEAIGQRFEKEFSTRSDYFNHCIGLFMDLKAWIQNEIIAGRTAAEEEIAKANKLTEQYKETLGLERLDWAKDWLEWESKVTALKQENELLESENLKLKEAIDVVMSLIVNKPDEETKMAYDHLYDTRYKPDETLPYGD